ncbi:MAG: hemerythrin family protein [Spirochaetes bacterium]|nr:hemerythrin family protein [Spirochaetota bacterium]
MKRLEWNVQYSVGVPKIDQQHAYLFELANRLAKNAGVDNRWGELGDIIAELHKYVDTHFTYEEEIMAQAHYDELEKHKKMHDLMRTRLDLLTAQLKQGLLNRSELIEFLEEWLTIHILREDMKYIPAVAQLSSSV